MTKNWKKLTAEKKIINFFDQKLQLQYLSPGLHKEHPSYRRSLQPSKENIQHFKKLNILIFFLFFVGHSCPPGSG
jgi:hypothetical protein